MNRGAAPSRSSQPELHAAVIPLESEPRWLQDHPILIQARAYLRTFWQFSAHPYAFGRAWRAGTLSPMNPLTFMASSATLLGLADKVFPAAEDWSYDVTVHM